GISVYEKLVQREKYMNSFITYNGEVKHGVRIRAHHYIDEKVGYLNSETPSVFKPALKIQKETRLTSFPTYYIAHCLINEEFITSNVSGIGKYILLVLMYQVAEDFVEKSKITKTSTTPRVK